MLSMILRDNGARKMGTLEGVMTDVKFLHPKKDYRTGVPTA